MSQSKDVVVIGAGLAGYTAALAAAENGADVLLLEKMPQPGGSSIMSGGSFAFAGTELQKTQNIQDGSEQLFEDLKDSTSHQDIELIREFSDKQLETYHWMQQLGITFTNLSPSGGQSVPRSHGVNIKAAFEIIKSRASLMPNITLQVDSEPHVINARDGHVTGVSFTSGAKIHDDPEVAAAAVIIATGGFSRSERLLRTFVPYLIEARRMGGHGNTGDGIVLGMSLGADLSDVSTVKATSGVSAELADMPQAATLLNSLYRGGIMVNTASERFVDESISYKLISDYCLRQPQGLGIQIFDNQVLEQTIPGKIVNDYAGAREAGYLLEAFSIHELAIKANLDPKALTTTIDAYNQGVSKGEDADFGRLTLSANYGDRPLINQPPFFAYRSVAGVTSTYGGLKVDAKTRVADVFGSPIGGLFAAGEIMGGFHGNSYVSGSSLSKSVVFGRVAGRNAALESQTAPTSSTKTP